MTLVELLVGATVAILAISMAMVATISQTRALQQSDTTRMSSENSRDATLILEEGLRTLGWGIDPRYAIDMQSNCPASPAICRDSATASDELAFVARNPYYRWLGYGEGGCAVTGGCFSGNAWAITAVNIAGAPKTVTAALGVGQILEKGRVMVAVCQGGQNAVMLTMSQQYTGTGAAMVLTPAAANLAPYNDYNSLQACHGQPGSGLFMVDRARYFVSTQGGFPWLMLDPGIDLNNNGTLPPTDTADLLPIAKGVEDMQVAYVLNSATGFTAPDSNHDWIIGNDKGAGTAEAPVYTASAPLYTTSQTDPSRFTMNPANVRSIRLTLTMRADRTDSGQPPAWTGDTLTAAENRAGTITGGRFHRYVVKSQVTLRNLTAAGPFVF